MITNRPDSRTPAPRPRRSRPGSTRPVVLLRALVGLMLVVGCEEVLVEPVPVASVQVVPADTTLFVDEFARLRAELRDDAGEPVMGREITWSSRSPAVASVDATGLVVGLGSGSAEILATAEGQSGSASVSVLSRPRIELGRGSVAFSATAGTGNPAPVQVEITNGGDGVLETLSRSVSYETVPGGWLDATLDGTAAPTFITLTALTETLDVGTHSATVTIADPAAANSPVDLEVTVQVQQNLPTAPSGLQASSVSATSITLGWNDNSDDETEFQLQRQAPGEAVFSTVATLGPDVTTYQDQDVAADGVYRYRIRACNGPGCSAFSNQVTVTTPPLAPSGLTAQATSTTTVDLAWVDNSTTETGFRVERRVLGAVFSQVGAPTTDATSFSDSGLQPDTDYEYRIQACNSGGCSAFSPVAAVTTPAVPIPAAPSSLGATTLSASRIDLAWTDNSTIETGFQLERRAPGESAFTLVTTLPADATGYSDTTVAEDGTYAYRVRACGDGGCSSYSNTASATTPPTAPSGLSATAASDSRIDLTWTDNSASEASFQVERSTDGGASFSLLTTVAANVTGYSNTGLTPSMTYDYRVRACNAGGCSSYTATATATTFATPPPASPTNLTATLAGNQASVDLAWTDNSTDEAEFRIQRSIDGGTFTQRAVVGANTNTFVDTNVTADNLYTYRVEACSSSGCSGFSNEASVLTAPVAPTGLGATVVSASQVDLTWVDASDSETEVRIERSTDGGATFSPLDTVGADITAYSDGTTAADTPYAYRVQACNATGCSPYSNQATATTPPTAPSGLGATVVSATRIDLAWTDNSATETEFQIERSTDGGATFAALTTVGPGVTAYSDNTTTADTNYAYRVAACNAAGCSSFSNTATATTPPTAASALAATTISDTQIDLAWTDNSATETEFRIERRTGANAFAQVGTVGPGVTTFSDTGLSPATAYDYRVLACNASGCAPPSNTASATTDRIPGPTGLSATVVSVSRIDLAWTDNSTTETGFQIERSVNGGAFSALATVTADVTAYSDNTTSADTNYAYRVAACDAAGCSSFSAPATATTRPTAPSGLAATTISDTQIDLSWTDNSATEAEFQIERRPAGGTFAQIAVATTNVTAYSDTGLTPNTAYDYRVRACNAGGCSTYTATASATTDPIPAPTGLGATAISATQVDLAWTDNSTTETRFDIQRSVNGGAFTALTTVNADVTTYSDNTTAADTTYAYRVAACDANGCSAFSNTATVTTPPTAPSALGATVVSAGQIDLAWTDNSATETGFQVERSVNGGAFTVLTTVGTDAVSYSDNTTTADTNYAYRVRACNAAGCSSFSNTATGTTPPTAASALGATAVSDTQIDLAWTDNSATETEFQVERSTDGGTTWNPLATLGANVTAYSDTGLSPNTTYDYRVLACNASGCAPPSNTASATTLVATPVAPSGLTATVVSAGRIDLAWTDNSGNEDEFRIERSTDGGGTFTQLAVVGPDNTTFSDLTTTTDTQYTYRVAACNTVGCSAFSNTATASTPPTAASGLTATRIADTQIDLAWTDNSATETEFRIERSTDGGATFALLATVGTDTTTFSDLTTTTDTEYTYRVTACNLAGCSTASNLATVITAPNPITGLTATTLSDTEIDLAWTDNSSVETEQIISRRISGGFSVIDTVGTDVTSYSDTGLQPLTSYTYRISVCNADGLCTGPSSMATSTTDSIPAPSGLAATVVSATQVDLAWTHTSNGETEFQIERSVNGGATWNLLATVGADVTAYSDNTTTAGTNYAYRVRACEPASCSSYSNTASVTTPPAAASGLSATTISDTQIDLSWTDNSTTETGFQIERSTDGGTTWSPLTTAGANVTAHSDTGLNPNTTYDYRVLACSASGCAPPSNTASATTDPIPAPSALGATVVSANRVDLAWTDNSTTETGFQIERSVNGGAFTALTTVTADVTTYSDNTTTADTNYAYRVAACHSTGCSAFSNTASVTTPPAAASGLGATTISDTQIDLSWTDNSVTETEFQIERSTDGGTTWNLLATLGANVTAHSDTGLNPNTTYDYRVLACNASGCAPPSNTASATTDPIPAPTGLGATVISAGQVDLAWTDNSTTETGFDIERSVNGGAFAALTTVTADVTTYADNATTADTNYAYQVAACDAAGCSAFSNTASVTTPPTAPSGLGATAISSSQIDLAWTDNSATETTFEIERRPAGGTFAQIATVVTDVVAYTDTAGLLAATTYEYQVRACNAGGCSAYTAIASATTP